MDNADVPPGGEGKIEVKLSTKGKSGQIEKSITVETDDPRQPTSILKIKANITVDLDFERPFVRLQPARIGETLTDTLPILVNVKDPIQFGPVTTDMPGLKVSLIDTTNAEGKTVKAVQSSYTPSEAGYFSGSITLKTSYEKQPELTARVSASVRGPIDFAPRSVRFFKDDTQVVEVTVSSDSKPFKILSVQDSEGMVEAQVTTQTKGLVYKLLLKQTKKALEAGRSFSTRVIVKTDNPQQPSLEVPVSAISRVKGSPVTPNPASMKGKIPLQKAPPAH